MFATKPEIQRYLDSLMEASSQLERGDLFTHEDIESAIGLSRDSALYGYLMQHWKRRIEEKRGIAAWSERSQGYRLCTVEEQLTEVPRLRRIRARRQLGRASRALKALAGQRLPLHLRRVKDFQLDMLAREQKQLRGDSQRQALFLRKSNRAPILRRPLSAPSPISRMIPASPEGA